MPPRLRVVRIIDRLNIGGPAQHVTWLTAGADVERFETTLITGMIAPGEGDMADFATAAGIRPTVIDGMSRSIGWRDVRVVFRLVRELIRLQPDIVHTHKAKAGAVGRVAAQLYRWATPSAIVGRPRRCAVVHTYHGHIFHSYYGPVVTRIFAQIERTLARFCTDRIVTLSERQRDEIHGRFRVGRRRQFRVVPLGIDVDAFDDARPTLRKELGIPPDEPIVGTVGRLCAVKNHSMLLEAVAGLNRGQRSAWLAIVGDGELRPKLEQEARRRGLSRRALFLGFRRDLPSIYPDLDVVALSSLNEGTPVALLEAMACGRPVVATDVGGVADILGTAHGDRDGFRIWDHGITVRSRDAAALERALRFLLERPTLRAEMGRRGRAFVRARMSRRRLLEDIESLYLETIAATADPRTRGGIMRSTRSPDSVSTRSAEYAPHTAETGGPHGA